LAKIELERETEIFIYLGGGENVENSEKQKIKKT